MGNYFYKCSDCKKEYTSDFIESNLLYLCPSCGKSEKNKPLEGVLLIKYDYGRLKKTLSRKKFLDLQPGGFWLYPELWPINFKKNKFLLSASERLKLSAEPLIGLHYNNREFLALDDTRNLTLSFKDRASSVVAVKALELGIKEIAAASTGNAGSSLAGICARLGIKAHVFVPQNIPDAKRIQIQSFGSNIYIVKGDYDSAFDLCLELSKKNKWYNRNTAFNPLTIEGKKSAAYDIFIATKGKIPDLIFVPVGDGVIISGLYKGFTELTKLGWIEKTPALYAVQSKGSNALKRFIKTGKFRYISPNTIADSISAGAPRNLYMAAEAVNNTGGEAIEVSDNEILKAQKYVARNYGILIEPASAAGFAGFIKFISSSDRKILNPLILFTGNGLKDLNSLLKWNRLPGVKNPQQ